MRCEFPDVQKRLFGGLELKFNAVAVGATVNGKVVVYDEQSEECGDIPGGNDEGTGTGRRHGSPARHAPRRDAAPRRTSERQAMASIVAASTNITSAPYC